MSDNDKLAFPWACIVCQGQFRGPAPHYSDLGRVCADCWQLAKLRAYEELTSVDD